MHQAVQPFAALARRPALSRLLDAADATRGLRLGRSLQQSHRSGVWTARARDGQEVVVKWALGPRAEAVTRIQEAELTAMHPAMAQGALRLPAPVAFVPEAGLSVIARAPGRRLSDVLRGAAPDRRAELVAQAGRWLGAYTATRRRRASFGPWYWLDAARHQAAALPTPQDRAQAEDLLPRLAALAEDLAGRQITQARIHGDLTARNLLHDGRALWGIDLDSEAWWPLAKDAARFLVQLTSSRPAGAGPARGGIAEADIAAFAAGGLLRFEPPELLDFFLGLEILSRLGRISGNRSQRRNTRALAAAWVAAQSGP